MVPLVLTRVPLHAPALPPWPKMHRCLLRRVPLPCLYFSRAWLCLGDAWRRRKAKGREHFSNLAVRAFPQKAGLRCTAVLGPAAAARLPRVTRYVVLG